MQSKPHKPIGELIRQRRIELGDGKKPLSRSKFGRLVGVEGATVYQWEVNDVPPRHSQLCALVQLAGMCPITLLGEQGAVDLVAAGVAS